MKMMVTLPSELWEEILSKVPVTSLRKVRSICKTWNTLTKDVRFLRKHLSKKEFLLVMMMEFKVYLMRVVKHDKNVEPYCVLFQGEVTGLDNSYQIDVHHVFHCDGLLLCVMKKDTRIVVWNPYTGQTRWITTTLNKAQIYKFAIGYEKNSESGLRIYKILRFIDFGTPSSADYQLYCLKSGSWKVLDVAINGYLNIPSCYRGISLNGNTYWFATTLVAKSRGFLLSFDFTRERFARLPLPFYCISRDTVTLSSVREEQLAVLFQRWNTLDMEIWVTTKISPNAVSWRHKVFLALNMRPHSNVKLSVRGASFFIDEERKVAVILEKNYTFNVAYIVGIDGSMEVADLGESAYELCYPLVCSYVPSLVQLN